MNEQTRARLWCHVGTKVDVRALSAVMERLVEHVPDLSICMSFSRHVPTPYHLPPEIEVVSRPADISRSVERFLSEELPTAVVFAGEGILTSAVVACRNHSIPVIWVNASLKSNSRVRDRLSSFRAAPRLRMLNKILAISEVDAARFQRRGIPDSRVSVAGELEQSPRPVPFDEEEWEYMSGIVSTRPVWLAVGVPPVEINAVMHAFDKTSRVAHRLLLVMVPTGDVDLEALKEQLHGMGLPILLRSDGDDPKDDTRVIIGNDIREVGLWYHLAPTTYLGGTLSAGPHSDPFEAAGHGSAVIVGDKLTGESANLRRLLKAGACRQVSNREDLARSVSDLLAPDRTAELANRAWEVITLGADVEDEVFSEICRLIGAGPE